MTLATRGIGATKVTPSVQTRIDSTILSGKMGTYFKCLCGDSEHLGLMEPDAVAVRDAAGRNWICYPIEDDEAASLPMAAHVSEVFAADATARRQGIARQGTTVRIYYCEDENELIDKLLADSEPNGSQSL